MNKQNKYIEIIDLDVVLTNNRNATSINNGMLANVMPR